MALIILEMANLIFQSLFWGLQTFFPIRSVKNILVKFWFLRSFQKGLIFEKSAIVKWIQNRPYRYRLLLRIQYLKIVKNYTILGPYRWIGLERGKKSELRIFPLPLHKIDRIGLYTSLYIMIIIYMYINIYSTYVYNAKYLSTKYVN